MKSASDLKTVKTLLKKQAVERAYSFKKGNFDAVGFCMRLIIAAAFLAVFILCFGKFTGIYVTVRTGGRIDRLQRLCELLTISYTFVFIIMTVGCVTKINREIFSADDIKLFAAMPVGMRALFVSKLISIYAQQLIYSAVAIAAINGSMAAYLPATWSYYFVTVLTCFLLPLITIAIGSLFALPFYIVKSFLRRHFLACFITVTIITVGLFAAYAVVLNGVKEILLGESIRYFFNEKIMKSIVAVAGALYPARWIADLMLGKNALVASLSLAATLIIALAISLLIIRGILTRALQTRISGAGNFVRRKAEISKSRSQFVALLKKEFLLIFRTPSYMFSYFTVAVSMPLMVYFCMSIGSSLVTKLVGIDCTLEMAVFLTLLFAALTNFFCATNISRDGAMFYNVKAMPVDYKTVIFSKIFLCMIVSAISQLISAVLLLSTGYLSWYAAIFLFFVGTVFSLVHVFIATRYDFDHASFSTEDDGEITESRTTGSVIILIGMLISFAVGAAIILPRINLALRGDYPEYLTYVISCSAAILAFGLSFFYLVRKLRAKYYNFDGGGVL